MALLLRCSHGQRAGAGQRGRSRALLYDSSRQGGGCRQRSSSRDLRSSSTVVKDDWENRADHGGLLDGEADEESDGTHRGYRPLHNLESLTCGKFDGLFRDEFRKQVVVLRHLCGHIRLLRKGVRGEQPCLVRCPSSRSRSCGDPSREGEAGGEGPEGRGCLGCADGLRRYCAT